MKKLLFIVFLIILMIYGNAFAFNFTGMANITVNDKIADSGWYNGGDSSPIPGINQGGEDNETEYLQGGTEGYLGGGSSTSQKWDIEGLFFNNSSLYAVGGFDFKNGVTTWENSVIEIGDLFFGSLASDGTFTPKYVVDITNGNIYEGGDTIGTKYCDLSDPFRYTGNGNITGYTASIFYGDDVAGTTFKEWYGEIPYGESNAGFHSGSLDDQRYYMQFKIDQSFWNLIANDPNAYYVHLTMECGNDTVRGKIAPVPEPTTLLLSGLGLLSIGLFMRKKRIIR